MKIVEIDKTTEGTFFRCLHDEKPDDPRVTGLRRDWYEKTKPKGLRAKVLIDDNGDVVGLCQYLPIEHSPFEGKDLLAILCIWVHGYEHLIGNQQNKGYLIERPSGYWVLGAYMGLGENRRVKKWAEIESTFWMMKIRKEIGEF